MFEVEVSGQVQDIFREYCLAFCLALRPADIARGFQAQAPRPVEPVPLGALISASGLCCGVQLGYGLGFDAIALRLGYHWT